MPHKRAKRWVRELERVQRATDLAPTISLENEPIPKSVTRILDAGQIRREYRKKRKLDSVTMSDEDNIQHKKRRHDATGVNDGGEAAALRIKPGESVAQFNRRVESSMMPLIKTALRQSAAQARKIRREEVAQRNLKWTTQEDKKARSLTESSKKGSDPSSTATTVDVESVNPRHATKEFQAASTSAPRRLNDVAQEPPAINKFPRGATKIDAAPSSVLSMAQKAMIEKEREKAIRHYRELKARRLRESGGVKHGGQLHGSHNELP